MAAHDEVGQARTQGACLIEARPGKGKPAVAQGAGSMRPRPSAGTQSKRPLIQGQPALLGSIKWQASTQGACLNEVRPGKGKPACTQGTWLTEPRSSTITQGAGEQVHAKEGMKFVVPTVPIMLADDSRQLRMVDCMCGSNCPVASACAWIGWSVYTADLLGTPFHPACDLLDVAKRKETEEHVWVSDAFVWAMECTTMSRARAIPVAGMNVLPMRGTGHVRGLPELQHPSRSKDRIKCEQHNSLVDWGTTVMGSTIAMGNAALEENPRGAWFWEFPEQKVLLTMPEVDDWDFESCALGGARAKKERWRGNVPELRKRRAECHHVHDANEWQHVRKPDGSWHFHTKEEREFTADHAFHVALSLTFQAVRM